eukprot:ctg_597.g290
MRQATALSFRKVEKAMKRWERRRVALWAGLLGLLLGWVLGGRTAAPRGPPAVHRPGVRDAVLQRELAVRWWRGRRSGWHTRPLWKIPALAVDKALYADSVGDGDGADEEPWVYCNRVPLYLDVAEVTRRAVVAAAHPKPPFVSVVYVTKRPGAEQAATTAVPRLAVRHLQRAQHRLFVIPRSSDYGGDGFHLDTAQRHRPHDRILPAAGARALAARLSGAIRGAQRAQRHPRGATGQSYGLSRTDDCFTGGVSAGWSHGEPQPYRPGGAYVYATGAVGAGAPGRPPTRLRKAERRHFLGAQLCRPAVAFAGGRARRRGVSGPRRRLSRDQPPAPRRATRLRHLHRRTDAGAEDLAPRFRSRLHLDALRQRLQRGLLFLGRDRPPTRTQTACTGGRRAGGLEAMATTGLSPASCLWHGQEAMML